MNIEFIKWLVGYGEGFGVEDDGYIIIITTPTGTESMRRLIKDKIMYPLLLQKAKTGWNKECNSGERILEVVGNTSERYLKYGKYQNIIDLGQTEDDKALEQALKFIYKQETE